MCVCVWCVCILVCVFLWFFFSTPENITAMIFFSPPQHAFVFFLLSCRPTGGGRSRLSVAKHTHTHPLLLLLLYPAPLTARWGQPAQWVMNELPFITINQRAKPINCQVRDEFVSVRMTDCSTPRMHRSLQGRAGKVVCVSLQADDTNISPPWDQSRIRVFP